MQRWRISNCNGKRVHTLNADVYGSAVGMFGEAIAHKRPRKKKQSMKVKECIASENRAFFALGIDLLPEWVPKWEEIIDADGEYVSD
uniref:Uncharacterized protein n=1 Tax=Ditylenchus dipsaci TaxID=166011 RepID=A0A915DHY0_9BILA